MRVVILPSARATTDAAARFVARAVEATPGLVLGLPTGRTPMPFYRAIVDLHAQGRASFRRATTFNLDEFVGLGPDDPGSYDAYMRRHLFDHVDLPRASRHLLDGRARPWRAEVARYETAIARAGGLDLAIVGIGANGHVGFNEPADRLTARTHRVRLSPATRRANAALFGGRVGRVPTHALSMGIATILGARAVLLLATGGAKAAIVARAVDGPVTTRVPASLLQAHPNAVVVLDRAAAARLRVR
jgi:glucosamine-6-phosphate deaminase